MSRICLAFLALCGCGFAQNAATRPQPGTPASDSIPNYRPATAADRGKWFVLSTVGPPSLAGGVISSAWGTMRNNPVEYGPGWEGFGKRYGMRLTGVVVGNAMEAGAGAIWGEDPRYFPSPDRAFGARLKHIVKTTFVAPGRDGRYRIAYARHIGNVGNNFLSNLWREESQATAGDAAVRCVWGITGRMTGNAFAEFWPDVSKKLFKK